MTGKKVYSINDHLYLIDEETGKVKEAVIQEDEEIPPEDLKQLIIVLARELAKKESC